MSRQGKHKIGSVRMGIYVTPIRKAIAMHLAELEDMSMTDIIWVGIETLAKARGVLLPSGEIAPEHKDSIETALSIVKTSKVKG